MKKGLKWLGRGLLALGALAILAVVAVYAISSMKLSETHEIPAAALALEVPEANPVRLAEGERLATLLGCATGCHGDRMQGQVFVDMPNMIRMVAPNITTFTAAASDADLVRLIRYGVKPDGTSVLGMPSQYFHHLTDDDLATLIAFLRSRPVVEDGTDLTNAYRIMSRVGLALGQFKPAAAEIRDGIDRLPAPSPGRPDELGEYLAQVACAECHGGDLQGQPYFPSPSLAIVRGYGRDDFARLMRTGTAIGDREVGVMSRVARGRFVEFTESEIDALYGYLNQLGGAGSGTD